MSELHDDLTDLSTTQEESVSGGFDLFFQDTAIETFGESQMSIENQNGFSGFSENRTGYRFRQTTFALFGSSRQQMASLFQLFDLFRRFF